VVKKSRVEARRVSVDGGCALGARRARRRTAPEQRAFLDHLETVLTDKVMERAYRYARKRVELLARCGLPIEPGLAQHLLTDAVSDTALGDAFWDPERCELFVHLCGVIRFRTRDMLERAQKYRHEPLDKPSESMGGSGIEAEASASAHRGDAENATITVDLATQVSDLLYASAEMKADPIVRRILDAYGEGVTGRREVAERAGLSLKQFDAARNRLDRMVRKLPEQLAADAAESMGVRR
jgi:hypothetical protein